MGMGMAWGILPADSTNSSRFFPVVPELPEVEHARERLADWLVGQRIRDLRIPDARARRGQREADIRAIAVSRKVVGVRRRGKFLRFDLDRGGGSLLNHLGMTGKWRRTGGDAPKTTRAVLTAGANRLLFLDPRRFGFLSLLLPEDAARLARLGPEPLGRECTARRFAALLEATDRPVKALLMDQDRIAGIGNIQATESLFRAGIHPGRPASSLAPDEAARLRRAVRATLRRTLRDLRREGGEIRYISEGRKAGATRFRAYGRAGEPCPVCRRPIRRSVLAGRSSFHCPTCQPPSPC